MKCLASERGATTIEYALLAALMSVAVVTALTTMGTTLSGFFTSVATNLR